MAYYVLVTDANPTANLLDADIARMCDDAATWLACAAATAALMGLTLAQGIVAMLPRVFTGYRPAAQRRAVAHRLYSEGLVKPPRRETATDRAVAEAREWGLVGGARSEGDVTVVHGKVGDGEMRQLRIFANPWGDQ